MPKINLSKGINLEPSKVIGGLGSALQGAANNVPMDSGMVCRICLDDEDPNDPGDNPFITPCGC